MRRRTVSTLPGALILVVLLAGFGSASAQPTMVAPQVVSAVPADVTIEISLSGVAGQSILAFQFAMFYDASVLRIDRVETTGTLSAGRTIQSNLAEQGVARVAVVTFPAAITTDGVLLRFRGRTLRQGTSTLSFNGTAVLNNFSAREAAGSVIAGSGVDVEPLPDGSAGAFSAPWPNPAESVVRFTVSGPVAGCAPDFRLFDLQGRQVSSQRLQGDAAVLEGSVSGLPAGRYAYALACGAHVARGILFVR